MENVVLEANERKDTTKPARKKLRREERIPGVFYSRHIDPIAIDVSSKALNPLVFTAKTNLISLKIEGHEDQECIIKDVQFDPLTDTITHFDLLGLTRGEKIQLEVPVQLTGSAIGVKEEGGVLQHVLHKLQIECLPKHIPEHLELDITNLQIGDSFHISDLSFENLTLLNPEDSMVVLVAHPKVKEEEEVVTEEEALGEEEMAEPEVISKGKAEEEEEEPKKKES
jgi:large subunit ribosomal protein L25